MQYLAIDTTQSEVKLAVFNTDTGKSKTLEKDVGLQQASQLIPFIDELLNSTELKVKDINTIVVNLGPGSYTSLRIGIATAKGLSLPHNIKVIGVNSFQIFKHLFVKNDENSAIIIKNTPKQVYLEINNKQHIADINKLSDFIPQGTNIYGNGSVCHPDYTSVFNVIPETNKFNAKDIIDCIIEENIINSILEPLYIKPLNYKKTCCKK